MPVGNRSNALKAEPSQLMPNLFHHALGPGGTTTANPAARVPMINPAQALMNQLLLQQQSMTLNGMLCGNAVVMGQFNIMKTVKSTSHTNSYISNVKAANFFKNVFGNIPV
jgi:hypothetical protein